MHLEEGTIHAWLDGELSDAEGTALEAHARECAACREQIAEARGLLAAASRIVRALDDVPSASAPTRVHRAPTNAPRVRRWFRTPQFAAAAAVMVMAVGSWTILQRDEVTQSVDQVVQEASTFQAAVDSSVPASAAAVPSVSPARTQAGPGVSLAADAAPRADAPAAPSALAKAAPLASAEVAALSATAQAGGAEARKTVVPQVAASTNEVVQVDSLAVVAQRQERAVLADASPPPPSAAKRARDARLGEVTVTGAATVPDSSVRREPERRAAAAPALTTGPLVSFGSGARCFQVTRSAAARTAGVPEWIQLVDIPGPTIDSTPRRVVMSAAGAGWYWSTATDGAIVLARVVDERLAYETRITGPLAADARGVAAKCPDR